MSAAAFDRDRCDGAPGKDGRRQGSFFGRRRGHKLRAHQAELIERLLPRLALDLTTAAPANLTVLFNPPVEEVTLEIGFGGGEHLVAQASASPSAGFIGCEPYVNGMAKLLSRIEAGGLCNIRLFAGDAAELLAWLPQHSLSRIELIFPDPWPKRRHWKRRFVQAATVAAVARVLQAGGEFRFVSDIDDYGAWTLSHLLGCNDFVWLAERACDWRLPWPGFTLTRYGQKAEREGRRATYLRFRRTS